MKKRLQILWDEVMPDSGPCPAPDVEKIRRRVNAAMGGRPRAVSRRMLRLAVAAAAAMLLITGAAAASGALELPLHNVLSFFFRGENAPGSEQLVNAQPISVSDDNYTLTVTTSLADRNDVYLTLLIEAKTARARAYLSAPDLVCRGGLIIDIPRGGGGTATHSSYDPFTHTFRAEVDATIGRTGEIAIRLDDMEEGLWLRFRVQPTSDLTLHIDAEGWGTGPLYDPSQSEGPVTLKTVTLSPLSCHVEYTADDPECYPVLHFLWADGTVDGLEDIGSNHSSGHVSRQGEVYVCEQTWPFDAVRDLSQLSAVIFEGMAYPLDGGEPYAVDIGDILCQRAGCTDAEPRSE